MMEREELSDGAMGHLTGQERKKGGENDVEEKVSQGKAKAPCVQKDPCSRVPKLDEQQSLWVGAG